MAEQEAASGAAEESKQTAQAEAESQDQPKAEAPAEPEAAPKAEAPEAEEKPKGPPIVTQVEESGACARLIKVEVPQERVHDEVEKNYDELRKTVFIKGFRPGHVPRHVLERRFGDDVIGSVKQSLMDEGLKQAVDEHSLRVVTPPTLDPKTITLDVSQPLAFELKVEVAPEFTIDNYKGLSVERPAVQLAEDDVSQALDAFRARHGKYEKAEEGTVEESDVPVCHAIALENGQEVWRDDELGAFLRSETIAGIPVSGLREAMLGAKAGDTKTFKAKAPDGFRVEELRGKEVDLEVTIDEIRRLVLPEATDEWARSLHFDDLDDLRDELRDELRRQREEEADGAVHERIAERLLELTDFDVPEALVERLVQRAKDRERMALLYRGVPREEIDQAVAERDQPTRDASVRQCKLYFIYDKIAETEKLFVTEDDVNQRIQAIALNYRRRPEEVYNELEREGRLSALRQEMREEMVRDFLVQQATVTDAAQPAAAEADAAPPAGKAKATQGAGDKAEGSTA